MTSLREDAQAILSHILLRKPFSHENSFYLVFIASVIQVKITMSSESSDLETSFDSDDSEINFIAGYGLEYDGHSSRVSPRSPETSSDSSDDDAAYTDEPLADAEWIEKYQEEMKANEELERSLKERLQGNAELKECRHSRVFPSCTLPRDL